MVRLTRQIGDLGRFEGLLLTGSALARGRLMWFAHDEVPVAYSMVSLVQKSPRQGPQRFQEFLCLWAAFNNIYTTITDRSGSGPTLKTSPDGSPITRRIGHVEIPQVSYLNERKQIDLAFRHLSDDLKHHLILHESTEFFVYRIPRWRGHPIETDAKGQRLNGVLNIGLTVGCEYPVWSPIDTIWYEEYLGGDFRADLRDPLAKQVLNVVYTVRNNLFHGGKRADDADDANDVQVVVKALPLLEMIVFHFIRDAA